MLIALVIKNPTRISAAIGRIAINCWVMLRDAAPDWASLARPGVTLAVYMGVAAAGEIRAALLAAGAPAATLVEIVAEASTPRARTWRTTLGELAETVAAEAVASPAILLVRLPKAAAAQGLRMA